MGSLFFYGAETYTIHRAFIIGKIKFHCFLKRYLQMNNQFFESY